MGLAGPGIRGIPDMVAVTSSVSRKQQRSIGPLQDNADAAMRIGRGRKEEVTRSEVPDGAYLGQLLTAFPLWRI